MVSPWKTGCGNFTSVMPRFATMVPSVVSWTLRPMTRPSVNRLLTSGRPNSVFAAAAKSMWSGCGFIVSDENSTLSISVTERRIMCGISRPGVHSSNQRPAMNPPFPRSRAPQ